LLTIGGIICFALGASALYTEPGTPTAPALSVDPAVIAVVTGLTGVYVAFVLFVVVRWRRRMGHTLMTSTGPIVGAGSMGLVRTALLPDGVVYASGEEWTARTEAGATIPPGTQVRVVRRDGLRLIVEPIEPSAGVPAPNGDVDA